jgi:3-dehydroquinate dehydratase-2
MGCKLPQILVLHGPNLNMLGKRETDIYGATTLGTLNDTLINQALNSGIQLACKQTNAEHELIAFVQQASNEDVQFIILNAAAFTHTSIALRDALLAVNLPFIEVHITNTKGREEFRHHSYLSDIAYGIIAGFGVLSYELALSAAIKFLNKKEQ